jgi:tetratricopeptide (TPR) repeat protein
LARVYAKKGFTSKAIEELKKLKNENPNYTEARIALGVLYFGNGSIIEAQAEWQKCLTIKSDCKEAKMYLELSRSANEVVI